MTDKKTQYNVINIFSCDNNIELKAEVNKIVRNLCETELETIAGLEYHNDTTLLGDALLLKEGASNNVN